MIRTEVTSSDLLSVGYDSINKILEIEFHSGGVYQYDNVPPHIHDELMCAGSHGKYFAAMIKNNFKYRQM